MLGGATSIALKTSRTGVAWTVGVVIAVLVILGILQRTVAPHWGLANLDSEVSIATLFSSALLWLAALWWFLVAWNAHPRSLALWTWWPILAWLALDEGNAFHERLEKWTGVDWQLLYLPVIFLAGGSWFFVLRRFRQYPRIVALLVAGAGAWGVTLFLEAGQNWGGSPARASIYNSTMILEESLEMIGSTLLLVAAMHALTTIVSTDSA